MGLPDRAQPDTVIDMYDHDHDPTPESIKATTTPTWATIVAAILLIGGMVLGASIH